MVEESYAMAKYNIKSNLQISKEYYLLELKAPELIDVTKAGQFLNLRVSGGKSYDPLLRRPLSIHDIIRDTDSVFLLYRLVGKGTRLLSAFLPGDELDIIGPLGKGFKTNITGKNIIIIGGGMGIAPLYYLSKTMSINNKLTVILGGNAQEDLEYFNKKFSEIDIDIKLATIDGSLGYKGNVIDLWENWGQFDFDYLYTCGPLPMLIRVQELALNHNINGQVSLEERMGCGIGLCLSCVCSTKDGNKRVCKEGPVLGLRNVKLRNISGCDYHE